MTVGERLTAAYATAWAYRSSTADDRSEVLRAEVSRTLDRDELGRDELGRDEVTRMVELLSTAWGKGTPPDKLWRPLLWQLVLAAGATVRMTGRLLRTPKDLKLPRGVVAFGDVREDEPAYVIAESLPFREEAGTQEVLAWAWPRVHDPADVDGDEVPVWLDVAAETGTAAVMIGERRVGVTTVPEGTYEALRPLDRRRKRCVPDGFLDLRRLPDGRIAVEHLDVELP